MQLRIIWEVQYLSKQNLLTLSWCATLGTFILCHILQFSSFIFFCLGNFFVIQKIRLILILLLFSFLCTGQVTKKTDVYSFGIVLLELICGCSHLSEDNVNIQEKVSNNSHYHFYFSQNSNSFQAYLWRLKQFDLTKHVVII
jgi:serine/threonine protein kinase